MNKLIRTSVLILFLASCAFSAAGDLDPTFGTAGKMIATPYSTYDQFLAISPHPDGGIACVGIVKGLDGFNQLIIEKRLENGSLDMTFGTAGRTILTSSPIGFGTKVAVKVQADGKILAAGDITDASFTGKIRVARLNANGTLDNTFNGTGTIDRSGPYFQHHIAGLELQSDGKVVSVSNSEGNFASQNAIILTRFDTDGSLDMTYGSAGVSIAFTGQGLNPTASAITTDNKVAVAGFVGPSPEKGLVLRFDSSGSPDATFDTDGMVQSNLDGNPASNTQFDSVAVQSDGKIVAGGIFIYGVFDPSNPDDSVIARYNTDGSLDTSFDGDGYKFISLQPTGNSDRRFVALGVQNNNAIVAAAGFRTDSTLNPFYQPYNFKIVRCNSDGTPDNTWGTNSVVSTDIDSNEDQPTALFVRPDAKVVVAGNLRTSDSNSRLVLTRYIGLPPSAHQVTISGRLITGNGRGLHNTQLTLTDGATTTMIARSSGFGYFRFTNVEAGRSYVLSVDSKRYSFDPRLIVVNDDLAEIELVALP